MTNKKGFTTIELLICFVIVGSISALMFGVVMHYKERQQIESIRSDILTYKYTMTKMIQDDIIKRKIVAKDVDSTIPNNYRLYYADRVYANLRFNDREIEYWTSNDTKKVYPIPEIPDLKITNSSYVTEKNGFFILHIYFSHPDIKKEYGINIIAPFTNYRTPPIS